MVKVFRDFVAESKLRIPKKPSGEDLDGIRDFMARRYREVAPDLPNHGHYHFHSAVDHLRDYTHDEVNDKHYGKVPKGVDLHRLAKEVAKRYTHDDTRESDANVNRVHRAMKNFGKKKILSPRVRKEKRWDDSPPPPKFRRGVGSK